MALNIWVRVFEESSWNCNPPQPVRYRPFAHAAANDERGRERGRERGCQCWRERGCEPAWVNTREDLG